MSRLETRFAALAAAGRKALTTFITAGDPTLDATVPALQQLVASGADVLELGIPFSDPEAEGPAIQRSSERGLANGVRLTTCLEMVRRFREQDDATPIVLMGYLNSVLAMGEEAFAAAAAAAGVDGLIMVNLPPEEAQRLKAALDAVDINLIFLVAPTTTDERLEKILKFASGFVYYVSLKGTTGAGHLDVDAVAERVSTIKSRTRLPVQVGFGIRDGASARAVGRSADGVVVGSALVTTMAAETDPGVRLARLGEQVSSLRQALDA
ncbi:MAG TPA: tryptophan synthase subunit alpha [Pseudomonadales bacterium]